MSKEYIKKIKQARLRINKEGSSQKNDNEDELLTPRIDSEERQDDDAEILDVANDINFDEEEEDKKSEKELKKCEEASIEKASVSESNTPEKKDKNGSERNYIEDEDDSYDLKCMHCQMQCSSLNVSEKKQILMLYNNLSNIVTHRILDFT
jgi:hypothetical protein